MVSQKIGLIVIIVCSLLVAVLSEESSLEVQLEALNAFKNSITNDPFGALADWTDSNHHCNWSGIACDPSNHVISISLIDKQLKGEITPFLGNLSSLQVLDLTLNSFTGHIPAQLGLCSQLSELTLYENSLSGPIPPELGNLKNLQSVDLGDNSLNGSIPESICNCTSLLAFGVIFNNLTGRIPSNIGNLANLQLFLVYGNKLVGSIPVSIGRLESLQALDLSQNQFSGVIPPQIGNLSNLEYLLLFENSFLGKIPSELGRCKQLVALELYTNQFTGGIPLEIGYLYHLETLRLSKNKLNSTIPASIFQLKSLTHLGLSENELTGIIPFELGSLRSLEVLTLHSNKFSGEVPSSLTNLTNLTQLSMSFNFLTGKLPSDIGLLYNLKNLTMNNNLLEGAIPSSITNCTHLLVIGLSRNRITGKIPQGFQQLQNLTFLSLSYNKMIGVIPDGLFNCSNLRILDLTQNFFRGPIKSGIGKLSNLQILRAHSNSFIGPIPPDTGNLSKLFSLSLGQNSLSGLVPPELSKLSLLQGLYLNDNDLEGAIPENFFEMKQLNELGLQNNKFKGPIPDAISKLEQLSYLNLHGNMLNGSILRSMGHLNQLMTLDLSHNYLTGSIPASVLASHVPEIGIFRHINSSSLMGNPHLCGIEFLRSCSKLSSHQLSKKTMLILLVIGSIFVLLVLVFIFIFLHQRTKLRKPEGVENPESEYTPALTLKRFVPYELEHATSFFSEDNIIGASSLSTVYKGRLEDGQIIAVKKLNLHQFSEEANKCFDREINTLKQLRHRNLVKVLGYAWESGKLKALVLEYMENGNLDSIIHDPEVDQSRWTLSERIKVFISIATGLDYLHSGYDFPIVHCDMKPSNILLDEDWEAHVSDFGTARMLGVHLQDGRSLSATSAFEGTIGYLAPGPRGIYEATEFKYQISKFAYMTKVTTKVDIFSFGIIVMEFLTKRRPTGLIEEDGLPISLCQLVEKALANGENDLHRIVDPMLALNISEDHEELLKELLKIALLCTQPNPEDRPDINEVLSILLKLSKRI
nr:lrr receptor-like serine/threonine-protein kinase fls2 [Quercus suber]